MKAVDNVKKELKKLLFIVKNFGRFKFKKSTEVRSNSVLVVETNKYHGETLAGHCKYFQDLGYNVDVFILYDSFIENPFCAYINNPPRIFVATKNELKNWLKQKKLSKYEFIFFNSFIYKCTNYVENIFKITEPKYGVLGVEHDIVSGSRKIYKEIDEKFRQGRLFTISNNPNVSRMNPHYFGNIKITKKNEVITTFIAVGLIKSKLKNHNLLIDAVKSITKSGAEKFKVIVVGSGKLNLPKELEKYFEVKGRLNFPDMFKLLEESDFILSLLDIENNNHHKYLNGVASGAIQLSLGFKKPMIINDKFGEHYEFSRENAIFYEENDLKSAMLQAINLDQDDYLKIQNNLSNLSNKIYNQSLNDLKNTINRIKNK